jgi:hypothetical protein
MNQTFSRALTLLLTLGLLACSSPIQPEPTPPGPDSVIEIESTPTPSPTIDWFPATQTPTASATFPPSPTPILLPGLGEITYTDNFSEPANWLRAKAEFDGTNSVIVERNRATIAINTAPATLISLHRELFLTDFYAEMGVSVNRCETADVYGLLIRSAGEFDSYRYILNCQGEARVERMRGGEVFPLV